MFLSSLDLLFFAFSSCAFHRSSKNIHHDSKSFHCSNKVSPTQENSVRRVVDILEIEQKVQKMGLARSLWSVKENMLCAKFLTQRRQLCLEGRIGGACIKTAQHGMSCGKGLFQEECQRGKPHSVFHGESLTKGQTEGRNWGCRRTPIRCVSYPTGKQDTKN